MNKTTKYINMKSGDGLTQKYSMKHLYPKELTVNNDYNLLPEPDNLNSIKPSQRLKRKVSSRKRKKPANDEYTYD